MIDQAPASADDTRRYAFNQGPGRDLFGSFAGDQRPLTTSFGSLPATVTTDPLCQLAWGSVDLLEDSAYPGPCAHSDLSMTARIQHALVTAFGLQRREPSNLFNDHRGCASVRSRFPVHAFVQAEDEAWLLDVYRHGLLPVGGARPQLPTDQPIAIALAGRFTHLPSLYGRLRGPLVELEMGISLRSLWVALDILGLQGTLDLPDRGVPTAMARLGLEPATQWTVPLTVSITAPGLGTALSPATPSSTSVPASAPQVSTPQVSASQGSASQVSGSPLPLEDDDPTLAEAVAVNRASLHVALPRGQHSLQGTASAIPDGLSATDRSWSDVLWQRSAGHMPRLLAGFSGRRSPLPAAAVADAAAWVAAPPPTPLLQEISGRISASVCLQDAAGYATGWYRLNRGSGATAELELVQADPTLPARLEGCYGHGLGPNVGCAVRHAAMIWLFSTDVTALIDDLGPGGWTLAQYACGWMAHGLSLSAAAHGLYARPTRAFDEFLLHPIVGMAPGEMVLLSVVSGAGRYLEPLLDLRT
jgi:hypothetical protein